jgi:hypothetical protein
MQGTFDDVWNAENALGHILRPRKRMSGHILRIFPQKFQIEFQTIKYLYLVIRDNKKTLILIRK